MPKITNDYWAKQASRYHKKYDALLKDFEEMKIDLIRAEEAKKAYKEQLCMQVDFWARYFSNQCNISLKSYNVPSLIEDSKKDKL